MRPYLRSVGVLIVLAAAACASTPPQAVQQMRGLWLGQNLYLRNFWSMDKFQVGRNGVPLGMLQQGHWEMAQIHVRQVDGQGHTVVLRGYRMVQVYNPGTKAFTPVPWAKRKVAITIEADPAALSAADVQRLAAALFYSDFAAVQAALPQYWQPFFQGRPPNCGTPPETETHGKSPPQLVTPKIPQYTAAARVLQVQGQVELGLCLSAQGTISRAWIIQPLGAGLDAKAMAAIEAWRFSPAHNAAGQAVAAKLRVSMNFHRY